MTQSDERRTGLGRTGMGRTIIGLVLIFATVPVFIVLVPGRSGSTVIVTGIAALAVIVVGIVLAGGWLGVSRRRREQGLEQQGCLQLLVTLLTLLACGVIVYYIVFYGASIVMRGES